MSTIVLDPGHGGTTTVGDPPSTANNATGPNGTLEKNVVLDIGLKCRDMLRRQGQNVVMTREADVNRALYDRAHVARDNRAEVFLSIHLNGDDNPAVQGTETWVYTGTQAGSMSYRLAELVQQEVLARTGYRDRGIKVGDKGVLNPSQHYLGTAACLVEMSFLTDPNEETRLSGDGYRLQLAEAISVAIYDYVSRRFELVNFASRRFGKDQDSDA